MPVSDYFANTYVEARKKFLAAVGATQATHETYTLPDLRAPDEEPLTVDVATLGHWYGPEVTSMMKGTSTSAVVAGTVADAFRGLVPAVQVT